MLACADHHRRGSSQSAQPATIPVIKVPEPGRRVRTRRRTKGAAGARVAEAGLQPEQDEPGLRQPRDEFVEERLPGVEGRTESSSWTAANSPSRPLAPSSTCAS